ncbi:MAG: PQQ-dependent sugar dehydrogenase [Patescibacteria group bacterium]
MVINKKTIIVLAVVAGIVVLGYFLRLRILGLAGYNKPVVTQTPSSKDGLSFLNLPDNFSISVFARDLINPRVIVFDSKGRMIVSEPKEGRVLILEDKNEDGLAEDKRVLLDNLRLPHGLDFYVDPKTKKVYLYVAETHQVSRYEYDVKGGLAIDAFGKNIATLPADGRHFTRTIVFGPNYRDVPILGGSTVNTQTKDKLYISVGSSCDVCVEDTWKRAAILESDPEGKYTAEFAGGLRNSVFFALHPETKEIWATEMGRDNLGDELPPDEINIIKVANSEHKYGARRYGWPFCYGNKIMDKTFKPGKFDRVDIPSDCGQTEPATIELPAHSAPLGLAFIPKAGGWPKEWRGDLLVAYHGSWNRSEPTGYKIVRFDVDKNGLNSGVSDFISGWLVPSNAEGLTPDGNSSAGSGQVRTLGRPVDLKFGSDSALYISDDSAGVIYRITPK